MPSDSDILAVKERLDIVEIIGEQVELKKSSGKYVGICPFHAERDGSFTVNPQEQYFYCFGCGATGDVIAFVQKMEGKSFNEAFEILSQRANIEPKKSRRQQRKTTKKKSKAVPLALEKSREIYKAGIESINKLTKWGTPSKSWPYKNEKGEVVLVDVRFEKKGKKTVVSFWYDGKHVKAKDAPTCLFNLDKVAENKNLPILIVEGAKSAEAADSIPGFIPVCWNGGGRRIQKADWQPLKDREIFIYPDDDQKKDKKTGEMLPWNYQPGIEAAFKIQEKLPKAVIVNPVEEARKIKKDGADIVEALQVMDPDDLAKYILNSEGLKPPPPKEIDPDILPFKILGTSDDGRGNFIGVNDRLVSCPLTNITKGYLLNLAPIQWWGNEFEIKGRIQWDEAVDSIIQATSAIDFDPSSVRGRGAWREPDGRICYHDGKKIYGEYDKEKLYIRRTQKDIGLEAKSAPREVTSEIASTVAQMSFETTADAIRLMAWTALGPFAGALPWRPAGLITGASGSGKTTVIDLFVRPVAMPEIFSGGESSEAGVRQKIRHDSSAVVIEEAEADTKKKRDRREDLFSLMRQSTSDNAPQAAKGTQDGKGMTFAMNSMFLFASISPEVEHVADDNRIFRINMVMPSGEWAPLRDKLEKLITYRTCRQIRALTWKKLPDIINLARKLTPIIQDETGADSRLSLAEGILLAGYYTIWEQMELEDEDLKSLVTSFYKNQRLEKPRDETEELVDRLLDERVMIEQPHRETVSLREILIAIYTGNMETADMDPFMLNKKDLQHFKNVAGRYGIALIDENVLAIAKNHHEIKRITGKGNGYHRQLWRHPQLLEKNKTVFLSGKARRCVLIDNIIEKQMKTEETRNESHGNDRGRNYEIPLAPSEGKI